MLRQAVKSRHDSTDRADPRTQLCPELRVEGEHVEQESGPAGLPRTKAQIGSSLFAVQQPARHVWARPEHQTRFRTASGLHFVLATTRLWPCGGLGPTVVRARSGSSDLRRFRKRTELFPRASSGRCTDNGDRVKVRLRHDHMNPGPMYAAEKVVRPHEVERVETGLGEHGNVVCICGRRRGSASARPDCGDAERANGDVAAGARKVLRLKVMSSLLQRM